MRTNADKGEGDLTLCGRPQVSLALRLAMLACAAAAYRNAKTGIEPANTYSSEGKFGSLYQRMALSHLVPPMVARKSQPSSESYLSSEAKTLS